MSTSSTPAFCLLLNEPILLLFVRNYCNIIDHEENCNCFVLAYFLQSIKNVPLTDSDRYINDKAVYSDNIFFFFWPWNIQWLLCSLLCWLWKKKIIELYRRALFMYIFLSDLVKKWERFFYSFRLLALLL